MSEKLGLIAYEKERSPLLLGTGKTTSKDYSEETARDIDAEVTRLVEEAHERVRELLSERQKQLEIVSQKLLDQETITGDELRELVEKEFAAGDDTALSEERIHGGGFIRCA